MISSYPLGAWLLAQNSRAFVISAIMLLVLVPSSWGAGWLATRLARSTERLALFSIWVRQLPILHLPWLAVPLFAVLALALGGKYARDFVGGTIVFGLWPIVLILWILCGIACLGVWAERWFNGVEALGLRVGVPCGASILLVLLAVLAASVLLGLVGGIMTMSGVWQLLFR